MIYFLGSSGTDVCVLYGTQLIWYWKKETGEKVKQTQNNSKEETNKGDSCIVPIPRCARKH